MKIYLPATVAVAAFAAGATARLRLHGHNPKKGFELHVEANAGGLSGPIQVDQGWFSLGGGNADMICPPDASDCGSGTTSFRMGKYGTLLLNAVERPNTGTIPSFFHGT